MIIQSIRKLIGVYKMNEDLTLNDDGLTIIKECEGFRATAYLCPAGIPTIGYGTTVWPTGVKVKLGETITQDKAIECLKHDVKGAEADVRNLTKIELNENQFSALVSWVYNLGATNLKSSTLLKAVNNGDFEEAAKQFSRWVYGSGKLLPGLVTRRAREATLFLQPV